MRMPQHGVPHAKRVATAICAALLALAPAAGPALARSQANTGTAAASDIAVKLHFTGGAQFTTTLFDAFVTPKNRSIANDSCGVWYRDAKHMFFELSVRFDQVQPYSSPIAASGLRLLVDGFQAGKSAYPDTGENVLLLRARGHDFGVDVKTTDSKVQVRIINGGRSGSFTATHYSRGNGPATVTVQGAWTCAKLFKLKTT